MSVNDISFTIIAVILVMHVINGSDLFSQSNDMFAYINDIVINKQSYK